jgi:hypothetical protein
LVIEGSGSEKKYSVEGLLTELENIRLMILPDDTNIPTKVNKRQRDILTALALCA